MIGDTNRVTTVRLQLHACFSLQCNCNGLNTRLPEFYDDIMAQAVNAMAKQGLRLSDILHIVGYAFYYNRLLHPQHARYSRKVMPDPVACSQRPHTRNGSHQ